MNHRLFRLLPHLLIVIIAAVSLSSGPLGCAGGTSGTGGRAFTGTVRTANGAVVEGASVALVGSDTTVLTNADGIFAFTEEEVSGGNVRLLFVSSSGTGVVTIDDLPAEAEGVVVDVVVDQRAPAAASSDSSEGGDAPVSSEPELLSNIQIIGAPADANASFGSSVPEGVQCGSVRCLQNEVCCNQSCGICTPPGGACTQQFCEPLPEPTSTPAPDTGDGTDPLLPRPTPTPDLGPGTGVACGPNRCAIGELCCNQSCGICTPPGGACIELFCE